MYFYFNREKYIVKFDTVAHSETKTDTYIMMKWCEVVPSCKYQTHLYLSILLNGNRDCVEYIYKILKQQIRDETVLYTSGRYLDYLLGQIYIERPRSVVCYPIGRNLVEWGIKNMKITDWWDLLDEIEDSPIEIYD